MMKGIGEKIGHKVSRFNSETGKEEIIRQPDNPDQPFTIENMPKKDPSKLLDAYSIH